LREGDDWPEARHRGPDYQSCRQASKKIHGFISLYFVARDPMDLSGLAANTRPGASRISAVSCFLRILTASR
jgi:hypothetical protein